jgi:hypothetical protein
MQSQTWLEPGIGIVMHHSDRLCTSACPILVSKPCTYGDRKGRAWQGPLEASACYLAVDEISRVSVEGSRK